MLPATFLLRHLLQFCYILLLTIPHGFLPASFSLTSYMLHLSYPWIFVTCYTLHCCCIPSATLFLRVNIFLLHVTHYIFLLHVTFLLHILMLNLCNVLSTTNMFHVYCYVIPATLLLLVTRCISVLCFLLHFLYIYLLHLSYMLRASIFFFF